MADDSRSQDLDALLADVERAISGSPAPAPVAKRRGGATPARREGASAPSVWRSVVPPAVVVAIAVGLLFFFVPFLLSGPSGALGALIGAIVAGLWARWRR